MTPDRPTGHWHDTACPSCGEDVSIECDEYHLGYVDGNHMGELMERERILAALPESFGAIMWTGPQEHFAAALAAAIEKVLDG